MVGGVGDRIGNGLDIGVGSRNGNGNGNGIAVGNRDATGTNTCTAINQRPAQRAALWPGGRLDRAACAAGWPPAGPRRPLPPPPARHAQPPAARQLATRWPVLTLASTWSVIATVAATATLTLLMVLLVSNLRGGEKRIERRVARQYALADPAFADELGALLGPAFVDGCQVQALQNGDEIFPAMLAGIRSATASITFETFIYWAGDIGLQFADALTERSRSGVQVHVLLDWLGCSQIDESLVERMTDAGVQVCKFHAPHWSHLARFNNRTHRKLLVIDGRLAYTGGVGIAPPWNGHAQDPRHWRDSHFRIEGLVVAQLQAVFLDNWIKATGDVLHGPRYFPTLAAVGHSRAQMFSSSPSGGSESMQLMYLLAITAASRSIDLSAAYFVPNPLAIQSFIDAMHRGVAVRIIVPGPHIDKQAVRSASRATWGELLAAGAVIAEYQPTMYHCKMMVVDGLLVSVGSTNFDNRSFRLNDEATLNILDADFAAAQIRVFDSDLRLSKVVSLASWRARPWHEKIRERAASLISAQL